jgi:hypothetical protein
VSSVAAGPVTATVELSSIFGKFNMLTTVSAIATAANQLLPINKDIVWPFSSPFQLLLTTQGPSLFVTLGTTFNVSAVFVSGDMQINT